MRTMFAALFCLLLLGAAVALQAQTTNSPRPPTRTLILKPDLIVKEYQFTPTNNKGLRVNVANIGNSNAGACVLRLTIRKIKGTSVGRTMEMNVPAIPAGGNDWILLITDGILPKDVDIKDTTFRLNVDVTNAVNESKETNNEKWHNL